MADAAIQSAAHWIASLALAMTKFHKLAMAGLDPAIHVLAIQMEGAAQNPNM